MHIISVLPGYADASTEKAAILLWESGFVLGRYSEKVYTLQLMSGLLLSPPDNVT